MTRDISRALLAAGAALILLPACDDDDGGGGGGALFSDNFERSQVGDAWTTSSTSGTMAIDDRGGVGGGGGLSMGVGRANDVSSATTTTSFAARPLTLSAQLSTASTGAGAGGIQIVDDGGNVVASAERLGGVGGGYLFDIGGDTQSFPSGPAGGFQTLTFNVDEQGNGSWFVDGGQVMTRSGIPDVPLTLRLFTRGDDIPPNSASFPTFTFDNVAATTP